MTSEDASTPTRPPYDPELALVLETLRDFVPSTITPAMIPALRLPIDETFVTQMLARHGVVRRDVVIAGHDRGPIVVSVLHARERVGRGPGFVHLHSGGMIIGNRFDGIEQLLNWAVRFNGVLITVEYRLAPEYEDPYPIEDSYAALLWTASQASNLGIHSHQLFVVGASAGGGLAAGTALLARDRRSPRIAGQLLGYPMLDDRGRTPSSAQFEGVGVWDRLSNTTGWSALLGSRHGTDDVSIYAAPGRATDLSGLPPAYIDVGSAEVFRDECVAYALGLWACGGEAELHVWPGVFHACDLLAPEAGLSREMMAAREAWITRMISS